MQLLSTKRLVIQRVTLGDAPFLLELMNDKDWIQNIGDRGVRTLEDAENYIKNKFFASYDKYGFGFYVIILKSTQERIGTVRLIDREGIEGVEIGYEPWMDKDLEWNIRYLLKTPEPGSAPKPGD